VNESATRAGRLPGGRAAGFDARRGWAAPWFDLVRLDLGVFFPLATAGRWDDCLAGLNARAAERGLASGSGRRLVFVDARALPGVPYERHVFDTGEVPTRRGEAGGWHDLFNALVWLAMPESKAALNRSQAAAIGQAGAAHAPAGMPQGALAGRRGPVRDAATIFDENGVVLVSDDAALAESLRAFDWRALFVAGREHFAQRARVLVFGHALLDKMRAPYKAACGHARALALPAASAPIAAIDRALAPTLGAAALRDHPFSPLPVLGIPGWCDDNADPAFYDDAGVFRPGRRPGAPSGKAPRTTRHARSEA
jgi:hypothetical protein